MNPFSIRNLFASRSANLEDPDVPLNDDFEVSMDYVRDRAITVPAIWCAVNFISNIIATLPLHVYQESEKGRSLAKDRRVYKILNRAVSPTVSSYKWRKTKMAQALYHGRAVTFVERDTMNRPKNLWLLPIKRLRFQMEKGRLVYCLEGKNGAGIPKKYYEDEVIDIAFYPDADREKCISPLNELSKSMKMGIVLRDYASQHFKNGGMPLGVISGKDLTTAKAIDRASKEINAAIRNAWKKWSGVLVLPPDHVFSTNGHTPENNQMLESRRFEIEEAARIWSISPIFLQDLTKSTYSNTEQAMRQLETLTLRNWDVQLEQEMDLKLFGRDNPHGLFTKFDMDDLTRGDTKTRTESLAKMVQSALRTPNEARAMDEKAPLEGGDQLVLQTNMKPLADIDSVVDPTDPPSNDQNNPEPDDE